MADSGSRTRQRQSTYDIPPPPTDKEPLKTNVYRFIQTSVTALAPLFPYFDEGSIVPCSATFRGAPGRRFGRFQHFNTVDEVVIMFGNQRSRGRAGMVAIGPKLHLVGGMLESEEDPNCLSIAVITQRQSIGSAQREELRFICDQCSRRLFFHKVDATPPKRGTQNQTLGPHPSFLTIIETSDAARRFNADEQARKCPHCGYMNPRFPSESWGWTFTLASPKLRSWRQNRSNRRRALPRPKIESLRAKPWPGSICSSPTKRQPKVALMTNGQCCPPTLTCRFI